MRKVYTHTRIYTYRYIYNEKVTNAYRSNKKGNLQLGHNIQNENTKVCMYVCMEINNKIKGKFF